MKKLPGHPDNAARRERQGGAHHQPAKGEYWHDFKACLQFQVTFTGIFHWGVPESTKVSHLVLLYVEGRKYDGWFLLSSKEIFELYKIEYVYGIKWFSYPCLQKQMYWPFCVFWHWAPFKQGFLWQASFFTFWHLSPSLRGGQRQRYPSLVVRHWPSPWQGLGRQGFFWTSQ